MISTLRLLPLALLASVAAACAPAAPPAAPPAPAGTAAVAGALPPEVEARVDSAARAMIAVTGVPGLSVAISRGGEVVFARGYGSANRERGEAVTPETVFRTGSVTKQFTAAAVLRLAEQGRLSLDDPIGRHLPDYPEPGRDVTLRQLLNHTSGIPSYTSIPGWFARSAQPVTHEGMLAIFAGLPLEFTPGEQWRYNNSGYYLLGMIVERVTGQGYAEHLEEVFLRPLGLSATMYCPDRPATGHAEGYTARSGSTVVAMPLSMTGPFAAGALCATAPDLVRWAQALDGGRVVSAESWRAMTTPGTLAGGRPLDYGYGVGVDEWNGHRRIHHGGGINGFGSFLAAYPELDLAIAVLQNSDSHDPARTEEAIARAVLGIASGVRDLPLSAAERARYLGTYDLGPLRIRIFEDGERLMSQATNQPAFPILYQGDHEFRAGFDERVRLVFEGVGDRAESMTLHQGGREMPARRVP